MRRIVQLAVLSLLLVGLVGAAQQKAVILVSDNPADYAIAQVLSQAINASVVVTPWGTLSDTAVAEIQNASPDIVYVIGGQVAVPDVEQRLNITVKRFAGRDRFETAALVAEYFNATLNTSEIIVVHGFDEEGIEQAIKEAKKLKAVIIFTKSDDIPEYVKKFLKKLKAKKAKIIPTPGMNVKVEEEVKKHAEEVEEEKVNFSEKAMKAISKAEEKISKAEKLLPANATTGREIAAERLIENAKRDISLAREAYSAGDYGKAFGLATAAKHEAEAAEKILEHIVVGVYKEKVRKVEIEIEKEKIKKEKEREREKYIEKKEKEIREEKHGKVKAGRQENGHKEDMESEEHSE